MKAKYWQKGEVIDYKNLDSDKIEAGDVVVIKNRIGVAGCDIATNETGTLHVVGVYEVPKVENEAVEVGEVLYYNLEEDSVTKTKTDIEVGYAIQPQAAGSKSIFVKIG